MTLQAVLLPLLCGLLALMEGQRALAGLQRPRDAGAPHAPPHAPSAYTPPASPPHTFVISGVSPPAQSRGAEPGAPLQPPPQPAGRPSRDGRDLPVTPGPGASAPYPPASSAHGDSLSSAVLSAAAGLLALLTPLLLPSLANLPWLLAATALAAAWALRAPLPLSSSRRQPLLAAARAYAALSLVGLYAWQVCKRRSSHASRQCWVLP
jgi:hypothetical protein